MSHAFRLLLLSCLACALACTVPTIEELEAERPSGCDADHKCPEGSVCFENRCIRTEGLACTPGTQEACGVSAVGECRMGKRLCNAEGLLGTCEGAVAPVFERCDGKDNDCDGRTDFWAALNLTKEHDPSASLAAIPVSRSAVGKADTVLVITTEPAGLVTRGFSADGVLSPGETFSPAQDNSYQSPALVAEGDTVAAAWIQRTFGSKLPPKVYLTLLDGSGKRTTQPIDVPYTSGTTSLTNASKLELAINSTHVLLLVTTTGDGTTLGSEVWAVTVSRDLTPKSVSTPFKLTLPASGFGLHTTANGKSDRFLVAYDNGNGQYVGVLSNAGALVGTPVLLTRGSFNHSPFIVPQKDTETGFTIYYVQNSFEPSKSDIQSVTCPATQTSPCLGSTYHSLPGHIERMQMASRPGQPMPGLALLIMKEAISGMKFPYFATLSPGQVERVDPLRVMHSSTLAETLVLMPDFSRYMLYQHHVTSLAASAVVVSSEAYLLPFCGP